MVACRYRISLLFFCSTRYLTLSLRSLGRYRVEYSKRNSTSTHAHVVFSIQSQYHSYSPYDRYHYLYHCYSCHCYNYYHCYNNNYYQRHDIYTDCINARLSLRATTPCNYSWKIPQDPTSQDLCFD